MLQHVLFKYHILILLIVGLVYLDYSSFGFRCFVQKLSAANKDLYDPEKMAFRSHLVDEMNLYEVWYTKPKDPNWTKLWGKQHAYLKEKYDRLGFSFK